MKVLMVEPGKVPYEAEVEGGYKEIQKAIGCDIFQATYSTGCLNGKRIGTV